MHLWWFCQKRVESIFSIYYSLSVYKLINFLWLFSNSWIICNVLQNYLCLCFFLSLGCTLLGFRKSRRERLKGLWPMLLRPVMWYIFLTVCRNVLHYGMEGVFVRYVTYFSHKRQVCDIMGLGVTKNISYKKVQIVKCSFCS